jgi:SAM-dependent methyltransferase
MNRYDTSHPDFWINGRFDINNSSGGYHNLMKDWWEKYNNGNDVLIVGEGQSAKNDFQAIYPEWNVHTVDQDTQWTKGDINITGDICEEQTLEKERYSLVICQSVLEHVFDPVAAIKNMLKSLKRDGILCVSTHPPGLGKYVVEVGFPYHPGPRDYLRFHLDFFEDFPEKSKINADVLEVFDNGTHIGACYKKL